MLNKSLIIILLFSAIFLGAIHPSFQTVIDYYDILLVLSFIILLIREKIIKSNYELFLSRYDIIFILLIIFCSVPALLFNNDYKSTKYIIGIFYPIRLYLSYVVFTYLFKEFSFSLNKKFIDIFDILLLFSSISALLSLLRYIPNNFGFFIDNTWPITSNGEILSQLYWGRLWGTMGGTNTAGNYFTIVSLFTFYRYQTTQKTKYFYQFALFSLCVLMSLSFGSIIGYFFGMFFILKKYISFRSLLIISLSASFLFVLAMNIELFYLIIEKRIYQKWSPGGILPDNLTSRWGYWTEFTKIMFEGPQFLYGNGPGGLRGTASHGNPENFYFRIFNESGFIGLFMFVVLFRTFFKQINFIKKKYYHDSHIFVLNIIILTMLVMAVSAETFYSNGVAQIFAIILSYISVYYYQKQKELNE